jgi:hypothetical protein
MPGLGIVLEDVFIVLGRDTEQFEKLKNLDYLEFGLELAGSRPLLATRSLLMRGGKHWSTEVVETSKAIQFCWKLLSLLIVVEI